MTTLVFLFAVLLAFVIVGLGCVVLIGWYWSSAGRVIGDLWPKLIGVGVQLFAGVVSLIGAYSVGRDKDEWFPAAVAVGVCVAVWAAVKELADNRVKAVETADKAAREATDSADRAGRDAAERQLVALAKLLTTFREAVNGKVRRLMRETTRRPSRLTLARARAALTPAAHLDDLLQNLAIYFSARPGGEREANPHVAAPARPHCSSARRPPRPRTCTGPARPPATPGTPRPCPHPHPASLAEGRPEGQREPRDELWHKYEATAYWIISRRLPGEPSRIHPICTGEPEEKWCPGPPGHRRSCGVTPSPAPGQGGWCSPPS